MANLIGTPLIQQPTRSAAALSFFDLFGTPDSAYSLRDLSGENPNVIRVRRSSDNVEQDFNALQIVNGDLITFTGLNDGFVVTWYDQSPNANHATQISAANQPSIVTSGSVLLENGRPKIDFSSSGQKFLSLTNQLSTPRSVFILATDNKGNSFPYLYGNSLGGVSDILCLGLLSSSDTIRNFLGTTNSYIDAGYGGNQSLFTSIMDTSNAFLGRNGTLGTATNTATATSSRTENRIGQGTSPETKIDGSIQEIIDYAANKNSLRESIEANINNYYTIY